MVANGQDDDERKPLSHMDRSRSTTACPDGSRAQPGKNFNKISASKNGVKKKPGRLAVVSGVLLSLLLLQGCGIGGGLVALPTPMGIPASRLPGVKATDTPTPLPPTNTPVPTSTPTITPSPTRTATPRTPTVTPTPDAYAGLYITDLITRSYGEGDFLILKKLSENTLFTRYLVAYPSDGLSIFGFMNVPKVGKGPYPVVIAVHGFVDPAYYDTLDYTTGYADDLARAGFLVIHPNLRGYPPSDNGSNLFRTGMAVDVLNLIALVRREGGKPGDLQQARPDDIGLWGHSMGGGIVLKAITVDQNVKAAVLYGAMSGDEKQNYEAIMSWAGDRIVPEELHAPEEVLRLVSPVNFLDRIQAAVSIHHGGSDPLVPLTWSLNLCSSLQKLQKQVDCYTYPGEPHVFIGEGDQVFMQRVVEFFTRTLGPVP